MKTSELEAIVMRLRKQGTDDDTVEVKRTEGSLGSSVWESVSAFGNTHGGTILLGLDEKNNFAENESEDSKRGPLSFFHRSLDKSCN